VRYVAAGMQFDIAQGEVSHTVACPVVGDFNVANLLGVVGALIALGVNLPDACKALHACTAVPGRMEFIDMPQQPLAVVDYAHTPDALAQALAALRPMAQARAGQLWCVFGCGGNRDASKRPLMARAAQEHADRIIVTSDNPRHESPDAIAAQVMAGFSPSGHKPQLELSRAAAIQAAIHQASAQDVILLAGKGHEDYQEIAGVKHAFSDLHVARSALGQRIKGEAA
jgi:MurE/MurF fusion protein